MKQIEFEPIINIINFLIEFILKYKISFRDSYLMLPTSLAKLAKQFKVVNKGIFPYKFVNDRFNKNIV